MLRYLSVCATTVALFTGVTLAEAKEAPGAKFIVKAVQGNLAEVQMGQLAQQNGQSQELKSFGQTLQRDHSAANQKATAVAQELGIPAPTEPNKKQKADYAKMAKATGAAFDKAFAQHMVMDHKKDIAEYKKAASMNNNPAAGYASETLPTLQAHLETAQSLAKPAARTQ
jgi:putative membrane protein